MWESKGHVVVTGSLGRVGRAVCAELSLHGIAWRGVDVVAQPVFTDTGAFAHVRFDLTDYGATIEALDGASSVIHAAAIAFPSFQSDQKTFVDNTRSSFNVFSAAALHRIPKVVWLSSEEVYGHPFGTAMPDYVPIDERHPCKIGNAYALAKSLTEKVAIYFAEKAGIDILSIRATVVQDEHDYLKYPALVNDPSSRIWSLWSYIDSRDLARACRLAIQKDISGSHVLNIAAADTVINIPSRELAERYLPDVPINWSVDADPYASFCDTRLAEELIGFKPRHSWRTCHNDDHVVETLEA